MYNRTNFDKLISSTGVKKRAIARAMNVSATTFYRKYRGDSEFTVGDIDSIKKFFNRNVDEIFFADEV